MSPPSFVLSLMRSCTAAAMLSLLLVLAATNASVASEPTTIASINNTVLTTSPPPPAPNTAVDIYSFVVHSTIKYRYAQTVISSCVVNKRNTSHEIQFNVLLPVSAFVSKFLMEINEKVYKAYVKENSQNESELYDAVYNSGEKAHIDKNVRETYIFPVSVNVEANSNVTFNLTYEEFLSRRLGIYENIINLQPGQIVENLQVTVDIEESLDITTLEVPDIKTANEIETTISKNKLAKISRESANKATITWSPTVKEQLKFTKNGVKGQFIVQYDVDHKSVPNQVLIDDEHFVHFFAPTDLKPFTKHVIFVIDISFYMRPWKLSQAQEALVQFLSEMNSDDFFSLIIFADFAQVWTINATQKSSYGWDDTTENWKSGDNFHFSACEVNCFVFSPTEENILHVKEFIQSLNPEMNGNFEDALTKAFKVAKLAETSFKDSLNAKLIYYKTPKPIIVFLSASEPTLGDTIDNPMNLNDYISRTNVEKYPIYSLGFGNQSDNDFLRTLSLNNTGFFRIIYEGSDAPLQFRNFYKEISSPVLSNVMFQYAGKQVDNVTVTKKSFNLLFKDTELVVAGKLKNTSSPDFNSTINANSTEGDFKAPRIVTFFNLPIDPPVSTPKTRGIGHSEKLWAYLKIQQLVDKYLLNRNESLSAKDEALKLALRYSFVTNSLTSLVVVKPNGTTTWAPPERIEYLIHYYDLVSLVPKRAKNEIGLAPSIVYASTSKIVLTFRSSMLPYIKGPVKYRPYAKFPDKSETKIVDVSTISTTSVCGCQ